MAAKKFASKTLNNVSWTDVCVGQDGYDSTVTIHIVNHGNTDAMITLAMTDVGISALATSTKDVFELKQIVYAESSRNFPGIVLAENQKLVAKPSTVNTSILVYGFEEEII